eukprot:5059119-Pyramimonas_sp.AAC.1
MDDWLTHWRVSTPEQVCPANTMAFDLVIGISTQSSIAGVAMQVHIARWSHRSIDDLLRAGLRPAASW